MIDPKINGKAAIVTGANHGIGEATAKALAEQGVRVLVAYYQSDTPFSDEELDEARQKGQPGMPYYYARWQQSGESVAESIRANGGVAIAHHVDLGDAEAIPELFSLCERELGPVEMLVINHTHWSVDTFDPMRPPGDKQPPSLVSVESIDRHFAVNVRGSALLIREFAERHVARSAEWGRIITLTTVAAHQAEVSYAASKHALVSYSLSAAEELGRYGITVNVVCPGPTQTGYITAEAEEELVAHTPLGRLGYPEDIANTIAFLASEQGGWLTGNQIYAAGGFMKFMSE
jgi:3-oxoacyl-[acyl-carrier protein] reductase